MYPRLLKIDSTSSQSAFLFGPRGTGKTFWLKQHFPEATFIDLLHTETFTQLLANPSRLEAMLPQQSSQWVVIDEVQKVPELLNEAHRLIEHKGYRFVLTGSSARSLRRKGINLLAGRALSYHMHPLTAEEMGDDFSLELALQAGLLPKAQTISDPKHYLETYVSTYLREEVLQEGLVRQLGDFARFLETASFSQGSIVNASAIAREAAIDRKIVSNYFSIVTDLLIGFMLPVFTKRAKRRIVTHPKFYFFDAGVFRTIRPMGPLDSPQEAEGPGLETVVLQHLRAINDYYRLGFNYYYWRTSNDVEVDFILYGEKGLFAFEIKRKRRYDAQDLKGLKSFAKDYPMAKLFLLYGGDDEFYEDNITVLPVTKALKNLHEILIGTAIK
jgi:predicted AAA+ superfamily ATPase